MLRNLIAKNISGKKVVILLILANVIYLAMMLITIPKVNIYSNGMKILDLMPTGYSPEYVNALMETLGVKGRAAYLFNQIPLDLLYPFFFGISISLSVAYILNKLNRLNGNLFYLILFPLVAGFFDYSENLSEIVILSSYPNNSLISSQIASVLTITKSIFYTVSFLILIIVLIFWGIKSLSSKKWKTGE
jgi:hypothetical protein